MKLAAAALALLTLAGCEAQPEPSVEPAPRPGTPDNPSFKAYAPVLYVDTETGCHYLSTDVAQVLVPRMGRDRNQVCGPIPKPPK